MRFDKDIGQIYRRMHSLLTIRNGKARELKREYEEFRPVLSEIEMAISQLSAPMRVAVAGYMKAGKSTLMNAILGKKIVLTGSLITTYTPTWFRYSDEESLEIVFEDGRRVGGLRLDDLARWTAIESRGINPEIDQVSYVILNYPNEMLKQIELIDTPGLFSPEEKDSERTIRLLGLGDISNANQLGQSQVSLADAIVYVFSSNFKVSDMCAVKAFTSTPINAIAAFTKLEQSFWNPLSHQISPLEAIAPIVRRNEETLKDELYCIIPVVAKMVEGFSVINDMEWSQLLSIADVPTDQLVKCLMSPKRFEETPFEGTTQAVRLRLYELLDRYGIYCVAQGIRGAISRQDMPDYLYSMSGVDILVNRLRDHFGLRSFIIKTESAFSRIERQIQKIKYDSACCAAAKKMCVQLEQELENGRNLRDYRELTLLRHFYEGKIRFPEGKDNEEFLRLLGEQGNGAARKLGLDSGAAVDEMYRRVITVHEHWGILANDPTLGRAECSAAQAVLDSVNDMRYHIEMLSQF